MAINSVNSPAAAQAARQTQTQKAEQSRAAEEAAKARQAQKTEPAKPSVNAERQKTRQVINVTA